MSKEDLQPVIDKISNENVNRFFRRSCDDYAENPEDLSRYDEEGKFTGFRKLGEIDFGNTERLLVTTARVNTELTERSGKKAQYEKAKKILKEAGIYDAGFFIFYDDSGCFRFSLVYGQAEGTKKAWSNFRRFTYFVSSDQTNVTFKKRVGEYRFTSLEGIKDAFSVEKVNKEFYQHIAGFFYRLTGNNGHTRDMTLPSVNEKNTKAYQDFAVRLIGRTIFCWFLKHKKSPDGEPLVPEDILSSEVAARTERYYHNVLEKLFFEVLNTSLKERKTDIFEKADRIPFLNGGLFEPHKDDFYDGAPMNNLVIPDDWFEEFFAVLERYNFTIDENSTVDAEVSVDPEMLGRIFENLLAEVNPDTGETARKATGSYYTPRVIVDYMVEQILKQYLLTHTGVPDEKLTSLLSWEEEELELNEGEKKAIIAAFDQIKIIDPACGSGAFPMGILHKMLYVLRKIDPDLKLWLRDHLAKIDPGIFKERLMERVEEENWEYIRKLIIIQNSIYGVDIQTIAVEISKLRFFLSLIVDEKIDDKKENRGVEALPNLEFKFVATNSLIGLPPFINRQVGLGVGEEIDRFKELRNRYLRSYGKEKKEIEADFLQTRGKLIEQSINWGGKDALALKLANWNPFSNEAGDWFDPEWMFGILDGFDVAIANPPYVQLQKESGKLANMYQNCGYITFKRTGDVYILFYENGVNILKKGGHLCYITSNKWMRAGYGESLRAYLLNINPLLLIDLGPGVFKNATVDTNILILQNSNNKESLKGLSLSTEAKGENLPSYINRTAVKLPKMTKDAWFIGNDATQKLKEKIEQIGKPLKNWTVCINRGVTTGLNEAFIIDKNTHDRLIAADPKNTEIIKPILRGRDIKRYKTESPGLYLIFIPWHFPLHLDTTIQGASREAEAEFKNQYSSIYEYLLKYKSQLEKRNTAETGIRYEWYALQRCANTYYAEFEKEKVVWPRLTRIHKSEDVSFPRFSLVAKNVFTIDSLCLLTGDRTRYLLGILNSNFASDYFHKNIAILDNGGMQMREQYVENILIPPITSQNRPIIERIEALVTQILLNKKQSTDTDTNNLESQIDKMVYELYELTPEEIAVVEGRNNL